jgi:maltodextrin utilization protein YvdJ
MSRELIGLTGGIATLLGILSLVLASFAKFFLNVRKRSQVIGEQQSLLQGV